MVEVGTIDKTIIKDGSITEQNFNLLIDTFSKYVLVSDAECENCRGDKFNHTISTSFKNLSLPLVQILVVMRYVELISVVG